MLYTDHQQRYSTRKTLIYTSLRFAVITKTHPCCIHNWCINLFLLFLQFGLDVSSGEGWESGGWAHQGKQIFFDLLELKASWVRLQERKKERRGEGREICHFKPLSLTIKLLQ